MDVDGLVLFPGAGSGADHPSLLVIEEAVAPLPVSRVDFAYRSEGRRFPDRAPKLIVEVVDAVNRAAEQWDTDPSRLVIGGRSMGGRMASMALAEGAVKAAGLVLVSYPLHPPKSPKPFAQPILRPSQCPPCSSRGISMRSVRRRSCGGRTLVSGPVSVEWVEGGRHELKRKADNADVAGRIATWLTC